MDGIPVVDSEDGQKKIVDIYGRTGSYAAAGALISLGASILKFAIPSSRVRVCARRGRGGKTYAMRRFSTHRLKHKHTEPSPTPHISTQGGGAQNLRESIVLAPAMYMSLLGVTESILNQVSVLMELRGVNVSVSSADFLPSQIHAHAHR